jgi:hypothetical protein
MSLYCVCQIGLQDELVLRMSNRIVVLRMSNRIVLLCMPFIVCDPSYLQW